MEKIDLHGLTHSEAIDRAEDFVLKHSVDDLFEVKIITGGSNAMKNKIMSMLKKHNFKYFIPSWNLGEIIVSY